MHVYCAPACPDDSNHVNEFIAVGADHATKEVPSNLKIPVQRGAPAEVAQHRPSTLRVLMHIMRKYHKSTFQSADATYKQFWENLHIGGLDEKWKISDLARLKRRFEWVLEFIETGSLPLEAQTAEELLWEALKDNALSSHTHPYSFQAQKTDSWLNPDLSPVWVRDFLSAKGSLEYVKIGIQTRMSDMGINGFCDAYGILVAWIWEKSMYQPGNWQRDENETSFGEVPASPRGVGELQETGHTTLSDHISTGPSSTTPGSQDSHSCETDDPQSPTTPTTPPTPVTKTENTKPPASIASTSHQPPPPPY
ncbi:Homeodomain-like protein [Fusarium austroafricanum]|uniref:Homeodomain-like protein n=1 Tax=Fusarium austroafricanum TaxID=2364996 RepID=A0A8H4KW11_9HYPO|nr:Homeodomain-like protein [Fusarium austroafricanum]